MDDYVVLARIRRARGIRGEVVADTESHPDRFVQGLRVQLHPAGTEAEIESAWVHNGELVLKFAGVDTRNAAEELRGTEVRVPAEERPPLPEGEYYLSDLVGCRVETTDGKLVGEVADWQDYGATPLLDVRREGREILVPFTDAIYRTIDLEAKRIVVELPEGLEDLNAR